MKSAQQSFALLAALIMVAAGPNAQDAQAQLFNVHHHNHLDPGPGNMIVTPSGLQYKDITVGHGKQPRPGRMVTVNYTGWLMNGMKFDSSYDRHQPFRFTLGMHQVIAGWDEGVATMRVGGKRLLIIPSQLAYGPAGTPGGPIPPNATLKFEVELLGVQ